MKATYKDHGGSDLTIVNAARVSFSQASDWDKVYNEGFLHNYKLKQKDVNLIEYLARGMPRKEWEEKIKSIAKDGFFYESGKYDDDNDTSDALNHLGDIDHTITELMRMAQHWVPFTHNWIHLHMTAPVPIARQCFKAKIGFTESEESRRYISDTPTLFIPDEFRAKADNVKQGSGGKHEESDIYIDQYVSMCGDAIALYEDFIDAGIAPEQARFVLPQGVEVQWMWSGNVASFARYYNQRIDAHAQKESQDLAKMVGDIIEPLFPVSWKALTGSKRTDIEI